MTPTKRFFYLCTSLCVFVFLSICFGGLSVYFLTKNLTLTLAVMSECIALTLRREETAPQNTARY